MKGKPLFNTRGFFIDMENFKFHYSAVIKRVVDGDTVYCDIDLGFGTILKNQNIRLYGIDSPEIKGEERLAGLDAKRFIENLLTDKEVVIVSYKDKKEKYGRYLAKIYLNDNNKWIDVNKLLIDKGLAVEYIS